MSVNKVILIGRLGKDPTLSFSAAGIAVCRFSLATNETFKKKDGERQEHTEWHSVVCFGRLAEVAGEYLSCGRACYIEGSIRRRKWQDPSGNERTTFDIVARWMQILSSNGNGARPKAEAPKAAAPPSEDDNPFAHQDLSDADPPF